MRIAVYLTVILCLILFPAQTAQSARSALTVWGLEVLPSLFPYMIFCRLLTAQIRRTRLSPAPVAVLLGMLGGSPSGAAAIAAYGASLRFPSLLSLCALTGTVSPMFLLGTMLTFTRSASLCRRLLLCHLVGAVLSCLCAQLLFRNARAATADPRSVSGCTAERNAVAESIDAVLQIGGCIICYSVLAGLLDLLPFISDGAGAMLHAVLEISGGMHALCQAAIPAQLLPTCLAAASGFTGLSILSQNYLFLAPLGVRMPHLAALALLRALGAGLCMAFLQGV